MLVHQRVPIVWGTIASEASLGRVAKSQGRLWLFDPWGRTVTGDECSFIILVSIQCHQYMIYTSSCISDIWWWDNIYNIYIHIYIYISYTSYVEISQPHYLKFWEKLHLFHQLPLCQAKADLHAKNRQPGSRVAKNASFFHGCHGQVRLQCIAVGRAGRVGGDVCAVIFQWFSNKNSFSCC